MNSIRHERPRIHLSSAKELEASEAIYLLEKHKKALDNHENNFIEQGRSKEYLVEAEVQLALAQAELQSKFRKYRTRDTRSIWHDVFLLRYGLPQVSSELYRTDI